VVGQLVETAGMESDERVLLSFLWSYNFAKSCFQESIVSSIYRDRLAELSGYTSKEVMDEISRRISLIKLLVEKNITDFPKVTEICRRYMDNPKIDLEELIKDFS
jgi:hypothetical protein